MKRPIRIAALALLMLGLFACHALADAPHAMVLPLPEGCVLVSAEGKALTERGAYQSISSISPEDVEPGSELFIATPSYDEQASGLSLLMNAKGEPLTDPVYDYLMHEGGVIRYFQDGLQGVMDLQLAPIVSCQYTVLCPNGEGGYLGLTGDPYDDKPDGIWYINAAGEESPTGAMVTGALGDFSEGLCAATSAESGRVGYLDAKGAWAISPQLEYGGSFKNGRAEACIESGYGIIDKAGSWLLTPKYSLVSTGFGDGNIILASQDVSSVYLIDPRDYKVKKAFEGDEIYFGAYFDRNYVVLYMRDKVQLIDEEGNVLMETGPDGNFDAWYAMGDRVIAQRGLWGEKNAYLVDLSGKEIDGPHNNIVLLGSDAQGEPCFGFTDETGAPPTEGGWLESYIDLSIRNGGVMDKNGVALIEAGRFSALDYAGPGYLIAVTKDEAGLVDMKGNWLIKFSIQG